LLEKQNFDLNVNPKSNKRFITYFDANGHCFEGPQKRTGQTHNAMHFSVLQLLAFALFEIRFHQHLTMTFC